jgi:hypothetical protein
VVSGGGSGAIIGGAGGFATIGPHGVGPGAIAGMGVGALWGGIMGGLSAISADTPMEAARRGQDQGMLAGSTAGLPAIFKLLWGRSALTVLSVCYAPKNISSIGTPYGPALQGTSEAALAARAQVEAGAKLYRIGTLGRSGAAEGQFWALESPKSTGFAQKYGIPAENVANADIITVGK